ncbi:hypothetical protein PISMIDRAFT_9712 [Pisolithus microcarpus 441]|uniref:Uncharacterized protein n=1 Tax=Pisolithus microcarpus 441 TaxID=765257 RepID=A0A0C9Z7M9_9AGAM|nr:hypothetical protein PISMIDRAFT_9712 [Pisolithus microcarpus 441]
MTYAHRETNVPLSIQVWEQGTRANDGVWGGRVISILVTPQPSEPDTTYEFFTHLFMSTYTQKLCVCRVSLPPGLPSHANDESRRNLHSDR